jgi:hypothetical protein
MTVKISLAICQVPPGRFLRPTTKFSVSSVDVP